MTDCEKKTSRGVEGVKYGILLPMALLALLAYVISGCTSKAVKHKVMEVKPQPHGVRAEAVPLLSEDDKIDPQAFHYYTNAVLYEQMGNPYMAAINYRKALRHFPESYEIRYSLAQNLYHLQEYKEGLEVLSEIKPVDKKVLELKARMYLAVGAEDSARIAYLDIVRMDPEDSRAYAYLAGSYRKLNNLDSTIWAYQNLVRLKPDQYRLHTELGRLLAQKGEYEKAKEAFRKSIEVAGDAKNVSSYIALGELYLVTEKPDSALTILHQALEIDLDNVLIHRDLRSAYVDLDSLESALPHARKEVELTPMDLTALRRLGMLYYWLDSLTQADSVFSALIERGDRHPLNYSFLGRIALQQKEYQRAKEYYEHLTKVADSVYEGWVNLGYAYGQLGEKEKELETYRSGLEHMRDDKGKERLLFALGVAYEKYDMIDESIATFEELVARYPDFDPALNYLGYMLADRGERLEYARQLLERAVSISPDNAAYLDSYGWVFYRLGKYKKALDYLKKAVTLDNDPVIFDHLGDVYQAVGNTEKARLWWRKALEIDPANDSLKAKLER